MSSAILKTRYPSPRLWRKATPKNGKTALHAIPPRRPSTRRQHRRRPSPRAAAKSTTEAIFDEPDSDDDLPIGQMTKQNGRRESRARRGRPSQGEAEAEDDDRPSSTSPTATTSRPRGGRQEGPGESQRPEDATAGDEELARRLAMGLPPRRASRGGRAPPPAPPPHRQARPAGRATTTRTTPPSEAATRRPRTRRPLQRRRSPRPRRPAARRRVYWEPSGLVASRSVLVLCERSSFDGEKHTLLYDDDEEEVVDLGEERYELAPEEAETSSSSEDEGMRICQDDEYTDKIKQEIVSSTARARRGRSCSSTRRTRASKASWRKAGTRTPRRGSFLRKRMGVSQRPKKIVTVTRTSRP